MKVLLLSDGTICENVVDPNEILIKFLSSEFELDSFFRVLFNRERSNPNKNCYEKWNGHNCIILKRVKDNYFSSIKVLKHLSPLFNSIAYLYMLIYVIPKQIRIIVTIAKAENISKIWVIATSPQIIFLAEKLKKKIFNTPFYITVWDPPEEYGLTLKIPPLFYNSMMKSFAYIMNHSIKLGVSSDNMKKEYETRFKKECYILQGDVSNEELIILDELGITEYCIIGFAGTNYTPKVWNALFIALDLIDWKLENKPVKIVFIGNTISFSVVNSCRIEFLGKKNINEVRKILSLSFINFVPYRFDEIHSYGSTVAFPSKLNTYLAAGKPIFAIAPNNSSPFQFLERNNIGIACNSLNPNDIIENLNAFMHKDLYHQFVVNIGDIYSNYFHPNIFKKTFNKFIE